MEWQKTAIQISMVYYKKIYYQKKFSGDITLTNILLPEVDNHILMHLSTKKVNYDNPTIRYHSVFTNYVLSSNFQKIKIVFIVNSVYQYYCADSDDTQTLLNAKDRGGLWRVDETVENIFIECKKVFPSFT